MKKDSGMTLLEIMVAVVILLLGVGFVLQSNVVSYRYRTDQQAQQQILFYTAGILESKLVGETVTSDEAPFTDFTVEETSAEVSDDPNVRGYLEKVEVTVQAPSARGTYPVKFITYRVKP